MSRLILALAAMFAVAAEAQQVPTDVQRGPELASFAQTSGIFRSANDGTVRQVLNRIRTDADNLRRIVETTARDTSDEVFYLLDNLVRASDYVGERLDRAQVSQADVDDVISTGDELAEAFARRTYPARVQNSWNRLRGDLERFASIYGLRWERQTAGTTGSTSRIGGRLAGTYELDRPLSDDAEGAADQAVRSLPPAERTAVSRRIVNRLEWPEEIAIERVGNQVTLASSRGSRTTIEADGRSRVEPGFGRGNVTTRATISGDRLEVVATGDRDADFTATFEPFDSGRSLRVTKRLTSSSLRQPVVVEGVYRRTSETARWDISDGIGTVPRGRSVFDEGLVPDGTTLVATLDDALNLRTAQRNDRVTLTVTDGPSATFDNAVIEGYITSASTDLNDPRVAIAFNRVRLRDGRSSAFDGIIESVRGPDGDPITFDGEEVGTVESDQRDEAIQRGAIGAAVGAVIGAVAGGSKGAAIGAVLGAGGAAATVLLGGKTELDLQAGTEFTIRAQGMSQ